MDRSSSSSAGAFVADLSAVARNAGDQPALVAANEVEHVGTVMVDPAVNEELITCPDHRDVVIHSDQGIMDGFLASFGASSQSLDKRAKVAREGPCHAAIGKISYADAPQQVSWLLLIKASLTGDESVDVVQYSNQNLLFPNSPTTNQFFGDSEWESYRALGYHIGAKLFTEPPPE